MVMADSNADSQKRSPKLMVCVCIEYITSKTHLSVYLSDVYDVSLTCDITWSCT